LKRYSISNKDLIVFFAVTFGLTILMGFAMSMAYPLYSVGAFPLVQMYYPALGAVVALSLNKELRKEIPKNFFYAYILLVIISICYLLIKLFIFHQAPDGGVNFGLLIGSIVLFVAYSSDEEEKIEKFGLKFRKNLKKSIFYIALFILLYLSCLLISSLVWGEVSEFVAPFKSSRTWIKLLTLPLSFITSYPAFLGEEYGWRYFLQSALQERIGKRKGVLLLGVIWGIWHLPINMFYYSPETPFYSVLSQLVTCISYSVFFGYVYMKTENIWIISMIHFINNNLGHVLYGGTGTNMVFSWESILFKLVIFAIVYIPFLLGKVYRNSPNLNINVDE
jgi:membrane protease YdiL (CAAX protease family)